MPEEQKNQEPKNDAGKDKRDLSPEASMLVDKIHEKVGEVRSAFEDQVKALGAEVAKLEFLNNPEAQESLTKIIQMEERLELMTSGKDGEGSLLDRFADLEVDIQKLSKGTRDPEQAFANDPRMEAFKSFGSQVETNPLLADQLKVDPRLTSEYGRAQAAYLRHGADKLHSDMRPVLGRAYSFTHGMDDMKASQLGQYFRPEVVMTLSTDFAPGAGIFVVPTMEQRILRKITEGSALLRFAGQKSTTSNRHEFTIETGHLPATQNRGERQAVTEDTEKTFWEKRHIDIHEEDVQVKLTLAQIEDSGQDIVAELESLAARSMLKKSATKLVDGSGVNEAQGLFKDSRVPIIKTGTADTAPMFRLTQMSIDILTEYLANARYLFGIGMLMSLILERDGQNRPLWQPSLQDGTPSLYNGFPWAREPYFDREDAVGDSAVTFTTGAKVAAFGDFEQLYWFVNRRGLRVIRNEITEPGFVIYTWMRRWGAGVALPDAGRILQVGT